MRLEALTLEQCLRARIWRNEVLETLRTPFPLTKEQQEFFYENIVCDPHSPHRYYAIIYEPEKKKIGTIDPMEYMQNAIASAPYFIGMGGITYIQWENRIGEISLIVNPKFRNSGYGEEAVELLLDMAFNKLNLHCVCGECYSTNPAMEFWVKITSKYHGEKTFLRARKYWDGKYWNSMYFDILREDYETERTDGPVQPS